MKKILLIIAIALCIFQMVVLATVIDIGMPAINRAGSLSSRTLVVKENPANANGKITSVEVYADSTMTSVEVATFFVVSGDNLSTRDTEAIANVTAGAKRTFTVDLDVQEGDYIGIYFGSGSLETGTDGGRWSKTGDNIPCENALFSLNTVETISLYGTGATVGWAHKWNTITIGKWNTKEFTKWNDLE